MTQPHPVFRRADPQVVEDDPFWSRVRRRHRDADIVLLPTPTPAPDGPAAADEASVRAAVADTLSVWRAVRSVLRTASDGPQVRWAVDGDRHRLVVQKAAGPTRDDPIAAVIGAVMRLWAGRSWGLQPVERPGVRGVEATDGRSVVVCVTGPAATVLTVRGPTVPVEAGLRGSVLEELRGDASWR